MTKCTHCGHDSETAFEACMAAEARCTRLEIELRGAAVALDEAGKLLNAATIDGTPMTGVASIMTAHAERIRALPLDKP